MKQLGYLLTGVLIMLQTALSAQSITYSGKVTDSLQTPLELANVIAVNKNSKAIASYGITDSEGRFRLNLKRDSLYILKASYLGYETWEETITAAENTVKNIVLKESANQLNEVDVVHELPVTVSGDTIVYKTDAFTDGREKKLENVLEKLPGFEVDDNGEVKVQGKKVDKVLVEGKEFFDGDTKMATKNIPANAVDKVQVLRNFNDVSPMKGLNDEDNIALNIKLKEGKKSLLFGDISLGAGPDDRYITHPNLFYYSKKLSLNFIGDLNNIGQQAFTMQDYFRFNGGLKNLARKSGSTMKLSSDEIGMSLLQDNRARSITSKLGALNFSYNPNNSWNFSGFAIGSQVDNLLESESMRTYIREDGVNTEALYSSFDQKSTSGLFKWSSTYAPDNELHIAYDGFIKLADLEEHRNLISTFNELENRIVSGRSNRPFSIEQSFEAFYAPGEKNIFSVEANHLYKKQLPGLGLQTTEQPFNNLIPLVGESPFGLKQDMSILTRKMETTLNYYHVLNKTNHLNFRTGSSLLNQDLISGIAERLSDGSVEAQQDGQLRNNVSYSYSDIFFGVGYKTKLNKLTVHPGFNVHFYHTKDVQTGSSNSFNKSLFLPNFKAKYDFRSSESISLDYRIQAEFTDVQNLAQGLTIRSYNSLFSGNRRLKNAWYHSLNLNYYNFNMFNFTNIYAGLTYQKKFSDIQNMLNYNGLNRLNTPVNIDSVNENFTGFGSYEKRFSFMKFRTSTNLSYSKFNNAIDNTPNKNTSFAQNYKGSVDTNFEKFPNFEIGFEKIINNYRSNSGNSLFVTNRPFANVEAYFFNRFTITADYEYNDYRNRKGGPRSTYDLLNAAIYYQKEASKWEFKLSGLNLLNTSSVRRDSFSNNLISTYEYFIQPRYFMLSAKYNL